MKNFFSFISPLRGKANAMLLAAVIAVSLCGCVHDTIQPKKDTDQPTKPTDVAMRTVIGVDYYVVIIDSCEYVGKYLGFDKAVLTHKGNCKFCAQRNKNKVK